MSELSEYAKKSLNIETSIVGRYARYEGEDYLIVGYIEMIGEPARVSLSDESTMIDEDGDGEEYFNCSDWIDLSDVVLLFLESVKNTE